MSAEEPPSFHPFKPSANYETADRQLPMNRPSGDETGRRFEKSTKASSSLDDLKRTKVRSSSTELTQNCSNQARNEPDINVNELAAYLDCQLFLPKEMSFMASLAYS